MKVEKIRENTYLITTGDTKIYVVKSKYESLELRIKRRIKKKL
jgi:hypothetical protein